MRYWALIYLLGIFFADAVLRAMRTCRAVASVSVNEQPLECGAELGLVAGVGEEQFNNLRWQR